MTSTFETTFLGQKAVASIDDEGMLEKIVFKAFPQFVIELSEDMEKEVEDDNEDIIQQVLRENERDADEYLESLRKEGRQDKFV